MEDKEDKFFKSLKREKSISDYFFKEKFWDEHLDRLNSMDKKTINDFQYKYDVFHSILEGYPIPLCIDVLAEVLLGIEHEYQTNPNNHQSGFRTE